MKRDSDFTIDTMSIDVLSAKRHLENVSEEYYEAINETSPEEIIRYRDKYAELKKYIRDPKSIASIGIGRGIEIHALHAIFGSRSQYFGVDISSRAIALTKEYLQKHGIVSQLYEANIVSGLTEIPRTDIIVCSATLHEVFSYHPDGAAACRLAIEHLSNMLEPNGILYIRDALKPRLSGVVTLRFKSKLIADFYNIFSRRYRTFESWDSTSQAVMTRKTPIVEFQSRFSADGVHMTMYTLAEFLMHFRNFYNDIQNGILTTEGDVFRWKEIDECYFVPSMLGRTAEPLNMKQYIAEVSEIGSEYLKSSGFKLSLAGSNISTRELTARWFAEHIDVSSQSVDDSMMILQEVPNKMELYFRKEPI